MILGERLLAARQARGVTLEQAAAATRIRLPVLRVLEESRHAELPPPVYVRGYLRAYAAYLETDAEPLLDAYDSGLGRSSRPLAIRPLSPLTAAPNMVLTAPVAGAIGLVLLTLAFTGYVYRALDSVRTPPPQPRVAATAIPLASPSPAAAAPAPSPSPTPAHAAVTVTATDTAWINVSVDGKPQFGDSGKVLEAGAIVNFTGLKVRITTGKGLVTMVTVNGRDLGPMGNGVITREYTAQT